MQSRLSWLVVAVVSVFVGALAGFASQPDWWLGLGPSIFVLVFAYLFWAVRQSSKRLRRWHEWNERMWREGKEPRYVDETVEVPSKGVKQYPIRMSKRNRIRGDRITVETESERPLTVEIVDAKDNDGTDGGRVLPRAYSANSKRSFLEFEADRDGTWLVDISNLNETTVKVKVIIHYSAVRD
jgi:hypothetical protein